MATDLADGPLREYSLAQTKRHKPCLIYRGHRYVQDKIQSQTIYWRCEDRSHCNGRAHQLIGNNSLPVLTIKHNHAPIVEDLSRHDIISVDSHRRRRRQNRKALLHPSIEMDDFSLTSTPSTMTSLVKLENSQIKQQRLKQHQQQHASMVKNLHVSEVITTAAASHIHHPNYLPVQRQAIVDPIEMTKLLSNITTTLTNPSLQTVSTSAAMDYPSRINQFAWEEIEGRFLPVIFRNENGCRQRYTSKMYIENTLFQSESWQRHLNLARSLPPLISYSYTEHELKLLRFIVEWHLASFHFKTILSTDCLIRFDDLLDFYCTLRKLRDTISTTSFNRPIAPLPSAPQISTASSKSLEFPRHVVPPKKSQAKVSPAPQTFSIPKPERPLLSTKVCKESGWVQINNVFVPYIVKMTARDNELNKGPNRQPTSQLQREFYVPYEILIKCNIFSDEEFSFKNLLIKSTQQDFDILNNLITNINIFDEKVPEKTLLVNLYHVMVGLNRILYVKFLPTKQPRTQVNKYHIDVLTHKGGSLLMNGNKLIPYIVQNNHFYVPLMYTFHSVPNVLLQAKRSARAPRQYEIDYLNLLLIYFSIDTPPLTADTLLVDIFNVKCSNLQSPVHFRTLAEHQQYEKSRFSNAMVRPTASSKSTTVPPSTSHKTNKYPPANVVVNPMIHHPSFYGLTAPKPVIPAPKLSKQPEMKSILFDNRPLHAIVKSSDVSKHNWKISMKEIFEQFSVAIDYETFIQWCQTNLLLPLIKLDEEERKVSKNTHLNDYYICERHLDRCLALLDDLKRGSISMTLLPMNFQDQQQSTISSPLPGAKKRKSTPPSTCPTSSSTTMNEPEPMPSTIPENIEYPSLEPATSSDLPTSVTDDMSGKSVDNELFCPIVSDHDDDMMPVVASVEEEQPLEDSVPTDLNTTFIIAESTDCNEETIQLHDTVPSCSSEFESSSVLTNVDVNIYAENGDDDDDEKTNSTIHSASPSSQSTKKPVNKRRQRNPYGKSRARSRSSARRVLKKARLSDDGDEKLSLVSIITSEQIEQYLRTLFLSSNESKRTRTRSVKTPTRLVEESIMNTSANTIESDSNVFDILSSSPTVDLIDKDELAQDEQHSCTYNVIISDKPNKLGLTIKKVASA